MTSFDATTDALAQNKLLFGWLSDDDTRAELYKELRSGRLSGAAFQKPAAHTEGQRLVARMTSIWFPRPEDVEAALQHYSVEPYSKLGSGGRFMLGLDDVEAHRKQRAAAARAMYYDDDTLRKCAEAAFRRVLIQFLSTPDFDLCELAEQVALNFMKLLFGLRDEAHGVLQARWKAPMPALVFQIIGRHFAAASEADFTGTRFVRVEKAKQLLNESCRSPEDDRPRAVSGGRPKGTGHQATGGQGASRGASGDRAGTHCRHHWQCPCGGADCDSRTSSRSATPWHDR